MNGTKYDPITKWDLEARIRELELRLTLNIIIIVGSIVGFFFILEQVSK
jgi:hypothetical protein